MVNNAENILVEFDYQNITVIDPNKIIDDQGKVGERLINHEDLVYYANLECNVVPRTKLAVGVPLNESLRTISIGKINFLNPGFKKFLEDSYVDEITGKNTLQGKGVNQVNIDIETVPNKSDDYYVNQTLTSDGQPGAVDNGLLGITEINVSYGTDFLPVIDMTLEDVKGRALFEGGNNSPYAAFFQMPYPIFYLTLKGYLGKAIRIPLMLYTFNSSFDSSSGNFRVQLKFYTYKYSILSYVTYPSMLAVPFMYRSIVETTNTNKTNIATTNQVEKSFTSLGYQKMKELYAEYKTKGLIDDNFPELTIQQLQKRLNTFLKYIYESYKKKNLNVLNDIDDFENNLAKYRSEVFYYTDSWAKEYLDQKDVFIDNNGRTLYTFKKEVTNTSDVKSKLYGIVTNYNKLLNDNQTLGKNSKNKVPVNIVCSSTSNRCIFVSDAKTHVDLDLSKTYFKRTGKEYPIGDPSKTTTFEKEIDNQISGKELFFFEGKDSFIEKTDKIKEDFLKQKKIIEEQLTKELADKVSSSTDNGGIGFEPTMRNILAVFFAQGEAFLRLMDDVHTKAWNVREDRFRKMAIFDSSNTVLSIDVKDLPENETPVYPWPQIINKNDTKKDGEKYELVYPGDDSVAKKLNAYNSEIWPEVEFVEEFIRGYTLRETQIPEPETISNSEVNPRRFSFNAIEFPIGNDVYSNTEEVKFFYEIYERLMVNSFYEKMNRAGAEFYNMSFYVAEMEKLNIIEALGDDNPYLSLKLKEYDLSNYLPFLRQISNDGTGISWQNFIRGEYNTTYIKNDIKTSFELINYDILENKESQPSISLDNTDLINKYFSQDTVIEPYDFTDIYPITNKNWVNNYIADGSGYQNVLDIFRTSKVLNYNQIHKIITNFDDSTGIIKLPVSNFNYKNSVFNQTIDLNNLNLFYTNRTIEKQYITEGNINYLETNNLFTNQQTTSILNTPYFVNAIQQGVNNFRYKSSDLYPYKTAAFLFLNSLPLSLTSEKFKKYENGVVTELDYIISTLKKYGAIHKLPYAWILKYGAIWHRYKTWVESGVDILSDVWKDFDYVGNFDPVTSALTKNYDLVIDGSPTKIVLQNDITVGTLSKTVINTGFYPKTLDDFNVFYQGVKIFDSSYQVTGTCKISANTDVLEILTISSPDLIIGSKLKGTNILPNTEIVSQLTGTIGGVGTYKVSFIYPNGLPTTNFEITNVENINYSNGDIQSSLDDGNLFLTYTNNSVINKFNGYDPISPNRSLFLQPWSCYAVTSDGGYVYPLPSFGTTINQTNDECFTQFGTKAVEVKNNPAMYNGSVRNFWKAPNYGYFDNDRLTIPAPDRHFKKIYNNQKQQENFSINATSTVNNKIDDMFSTFDKNALDILEKEFLNFSRSIYDYETSLKPKNNVELNSEYEFKNFQALMRLLMKVKKPTTTTGDLIVNEITQSQLSNFEKYFGLFMEYQVTLKYGNPSNFDKKLFYSFSNLFIQDPYTYNYYKTNSPNALPTIPNTITLAQSKTLYPDVWKTLETYVGFSEVPNLKYTNNGSYITDFFIDLNVEFNETNVINFAPLIKIYATQKLKDNTLDRNKFFQLMTDYLSDNENYINTVLQLELTSVRKSISPITIKQEGKNVKADIDGEQTRYEIYDLLKGLNDTWIAGGDFKTKTLFEDVLLFDRASRDVGQKIFADIFKVKDTIEYAGYANKMIDIVTSIITENNFTYFLLPAYANFYNVQDVSKNPSPSPEGSLEFANSLFGTFTTVDYRETTSKFLCLYANKASEHLAINNNIDYRYRDDAFDLRRASDNPLLEDQDDKQDWDKSNKVVGFNVDIGPQNQQVFKHFDVSQEPGLPTTESLEMLNQMANLSRNRGGSSQSVSLFNVYKNRSYKCSVDMLGNAMIQPMMYFNLRHVPMFSGPYMITKVSHRINDTGFETSFEGQRQPFYSIPAIDNYLQSLNTKILTTLRQKIQEEDNRLSETPENIISEKNSSVSYADTGIGTNTTQSCAENLTRGYQSWVNITPTETTQKFKDVYTKLIKIINDVNLTSDQKTLFLTFIMVTMYIGSKDSGNFKSYNHNYSAIPLNINWGSAASYFNLEYFCVNQGTNLKVPMAVFSDVDKFLNFMTNKYLGKVASIESYFDPSETNPDEKIFKAITKAYILDFPNNKSPEVYNKMIEPDKDKIKNKVKQTIKLIDSLTV